MKKTVLNTFLAFVCLGLLVGLFALNQQVQQLKEKQLAVQYEGAVSDKPGLLIEIGDETHFIQTLDLTSQNFPPFKSTKFHADIKGFLRVQKNGVYSLELSSDDSAILYLDGLPVIKNRGYHPFKSKKEEKFLLAGWHSLLVRYDNLTQAAAVKVAMALKGKERKTLGEGDLFLAKIPILPPNQRDLPPAPTTVAETFAKEELVLNQWRVLLGVGLVLGLLGLFLRGRFRLRFHSWQSWAALGIFLLAVWLRGIYYFSHLHQRIIGITDGGDYYYFLLLALRFVTHGEFIALNCGNLPVLIPLLGSLYKFFGFFPGIHYYAILMVVLGSLVTLFPWFLLRQASAGWAGLVGGVFLALNPALIQINIPYVSSELLGLFAFALALCFSVKALNDSNRSSFILAGIFLALMPLTRTVFIPLSAALAVGLVVLSKKRIRALTTLLIFGSLLFAYEVIAQKELLSRYIETNSYFYYFIQDGLGGSVIHRAGNMPQNWWEIPLWLPLYITPYLKISFSQLLPTWFHGIYWNVALVILLGCFSALLLWRSSRVGLFLLGAFIIYLFEISSYHVHERLIFPLLFLLCLVLSLGLAQIKNKVVRSSSLLLLGVLFLSGIIHAGAQTAVVTRENLKNKKYLAWVKNTAPEKSILMTDKLLDPWSLHQETGLPVFYNAPNLPTFVVSRGVVPVRRVTYLAQQALDAKSFHPKIEKVGFDHQAYALDALSQLGHRFFLVQKEHAVSLNSHPAFMTRKWATYPGEPDRGLWELSSKNGSFQVKEELGHFSYPENFDQFLTYWKKE